MENTHTAPSNASPPSETRGQEEVRKDGRLSATEAIASRSRKTSAANALTPSTNRPASKAGERSSEAGGAQEASQIIPGLRQRPARLALEEMLPQGLALALFQGLFLEEPALKWLMAHSLASTSSCDRLAARPTG